MILRLLEDRICDMLDRDSSWWGVRRLKPAVDRPDPSTTLGIICLVYGVAAAALGYGQGWLSARLISAMNPLRDDADWLPRAFAWLAAVVFALTQCISMWFWNRRAFRLNPAAFRSRRPGRADADARPGAAAGPA